MFYCLSLASIVTISYVMFSYRNSTATNEIHQGLYCPLLVNTEESNQTFGDSTFINIQKQDDNYQINVRNKQ